MAQLQRTREESKFKITSLKTLNGTALQKTAKEHAKEIYVKI